MALGHGAKIVKNGLVFAYDMGPNPGANKSWKGKPTTNILYNSGAVNLSSASDIYVNSTKTSLGNNRYKFVNDGTGVSTIRLYCNLANLTNGSTYGCSVYYKDLIGTLSFDWCDTTITGINSATNSSIGRLYGTGVRSTYDGTFRFLDISLSSGGSVILYDAQIELNSFVTPFVNGTRSNTEALLDWTGNNTITAGGLVYNSDNTFSFASSLLDTTIGSGRNVASNPITIQAFVKSNTTSGARMWIDVTSNGTNQRLYSTLNAVGQSSGMGIQGSAWNSSIPIDTNWHYQAIVLDGSTATAYDNGVVASSKAYTSYTLPGNIIVGGRSGYYWSGEISAFSVYDRALTADEVKTNFNALRGRYGI